MHLFAVRAKDANGSWSLDNKWLFVINASLPPLPNITNAEYYIDNDPGYGNGIPINISGNTNFADITTNINTASLSIGVHLLVFVPEMQMVAGALITNGYS